jgi:hypothetical protein
MAKPRKYRTESKYILNDAAARVLSQRLSFTMRPDPNADESGGYRVTSVYFDDAFMRAYRQKIDGVPDRIKFRVRMYNESDSFMTLEAKIKIAGKIAKENVVVSKEEFKSLLRGDYGFLLNRTEPAALEMYKQSRVWAGFRPSVVVDYYRTVFVCPYGNVRISFDSDLRGAFPRDIIFEDTPWLYVFPKGQTVLEIKFDRFIPSYIKQMFSGFDMTCQSVSKYMLCLEKIRGTTLL